MNPHISDDNEQSLSDVTTNHEVNTSMSGYNTSWQSSASTVDAIDAIVESEIHMDILDSNMTVLDSNMTILNDVLNDETVHTTQPIHDTSIVRDKTSTTNTHDITMGSEREVNKRKSKRPTRKSAKIDGPPTGLIPHSMRKSTRVSSPFPALPVLPHNEQPSYSHITSDQILNDCRPFCIWSIASILSCGISYLYHPQCFFDPEQGIPFIQLRCCGCYTDGELSPSYVCCHYIGGYITCGILPLWSNLINDKCFGLVDSSTGELKDELPLCCLIPASVYIQACC